MRKTRKQVIAALRKLRNNSQDTLNTAAYWNEYVRKPDDPEVIADPDGQLGRIVSAVDAFLASDTGEGPINVNWEGVTNGQPE